jgi:tetratricopeptide (TPR) repeat protein
MRASDDLERPKLFISYSRRDAESFVDELSTALDLLGFIVYLDRNAISAGEEWKPRLRRLIAQSDTVLFVISPEGIRSDICRWEIEESLGQSKRLLPILLKKPAAYDEIPPLLADVQFTRFDDGRGFSRSLSDLVAALRLDIEWMREHTRLAELAGRWNALGRPEAMLLRGEVLGATQSWRSQRKNTFPSITLLQSEFIVASDDAQRTRDREQQLNEESRARTSQEIADHKKRGRQLRTTAWGLAIVLALGALTVFGLIAVRSYGKWTATSCDLEAAETDNEVHVPGVDFDKINSAKATPACEGALRFDPENPRLMHNLARSLDRNGQHDQAFQWYNRAAEKDFAAAENNLGVLYLHGKGTKMDLAKAVAYIGRAASHGNIEAITNFSATDYSTLFTDDPEWSMVLEDALVKIGSLPPASKEGKWNENLLKAIEAFKRRYNIPDSGVTLHVLQRLDVLDDLTGLIKR